MKPIRFACVVLLLVGLSVSINAELARGQRYVIRVPSAALQFGGSSLWNGTVTYSATIDGTADAITVNGASDWLSKGFLNDQALTLQKMGTDRKTGQYELEFGGDKTVIKLRFANETTAATLVPRLMIAATNTAEIAAHMTAANAAIAVKIFAGPLSSTPVERQNRVLSAVRTFSKTPPAVEEYKGKRYLVIHLGAGEYVYNTLQMNQTKRVSQRMADVLGVIKSFDKAAGGCPEGLDGIKAAAQATYRDFVTNKYGIDGVDAIQAYVPCPLIHQFAEADITSQALANASIILVAGDRVEVTLNQ
ncbi:MAG TPA: hypothetical protein VN380_01220 [Thermoanaerobaculia bacterium]|jgi:hypothetical protein|nr:hypothetical protein [Thermoanaerobaculia bacterium]